jgi:hypothetical protein
LYCLVRLLSFVNELSITFPHWTSFLQISVTELRDPHRSGHRQSIHPSEVNRQPSILIAAYRSGTLTIERSLGFVNPVPPCNPLC